MPGPTSPATAISPNGARRIDADLIAREEWEHSMWEQAQRRRDSGAMAHHSRQLSIVRRAIRTHRVIYHDVMLQADAS